MQLTTKERQSSWHSVNNLNVESFLVSRNFCSATSKQCCHMKFQEQLIMLMNPKFLVDSYFY